MILQASSLWQKRNYPPLWPTDRKNTSYLFHQLARVRLTVYC